MFKLIKISRSIKNSIPEEIKIHFKLALTSSNDPRWMRFANVNGIRVFVFLAGFYQNLGDMAITFAQVEFLKEIYPNATIICVPSTQTYNSIKTIKQFIRDSDLITITGGGNMDEEYPSLENARLFVIKSFPNNRIVSFPQSFNYSNSLKGIKWKEKSRSVYEKHRNLTVYAREKDSLERLKRAFPRLNVELCPDIVLYLNKSINKSIRDSVLCCLRSDKEQSISGADKSQLLELVYKNFGRVYEADTTDVQIEQCTEEQYENTLEKYWSLVRNCRVVLTDRLHCMIFCVITGTPCVAIDNKNRKISSVYDTWLTGIPYIKVFRHVNIDEILTCMNELYYHNENAKNTYSVNDRFEVLKAMI